MTKISKMTNEQLADALDNIDDFIHPPSIIGLAAARLRAKRDEGGEDDAADDLWRKKYEDEYAIVARIWRILGSPSYEELDGRSIFDLIIELRDKPTPAAVSAPAMEMLYEVISVAREVQRIWPDDCTEPSRIALLEEVIAALTHPKLSAQAEGKKDGPETKAGGASSETSVLRAEIGEWKAVSAVWERHNDILRKFVHEIADAMPHPAGGMLLMEMDKRLSCESAAEKGDATAQASATIPHIEKQDTISNLTVTQKPFPAQPDCEDGGRDLPDEWKKHLLDPNIVWANMLRGTIAIPRHLQQPPANVSGRAITKEEEALVEAAVNYGNDPLDQRWACELIACAEAVAASRTSGEGGE